MTARRFLLASLVPLALALVALLAAPAHAAPVTRSAQSTHAVVSAPASSTPLRVRAMAWARTRAGDWYQWGGAGPSVFDCSGLVMWAYARVGVSLPHSTYAMLSSWHLVRTYSPQQGDLAFYGSGHVELVTTWWHTTFGAQEPGTRVGWHQWGGWWHPTAYYRVR